MDRNWKDILEKFICSIQNRVCRLKLNIRNLEQLRNSKSSGKRKSSTINTKVITTDVAIIWQHFKLVIEWQNLNEQKNRKYSNEKIDKRGNKWLLWNQNNSNQIAIILNKTLTVSLFSEKMEMTDGRIRENSLKRLQVSNLINIFVTGFQMQRRKDYCYKHIRRNIDSKLYK